MTRINRASTYSGEDPPAISVKTIEQVIREQGGQQLPPGSVPEDRVAPSTTEGDVQVTEQGKTQWTASENLSGVITARDEAASAAADAATAQAAADAAQADADTVAGDLSAHITDTTAHPAAYITVTDAMAYYAATNVEDALEEAAEAILDHVNDTTSAHLASAIENVPSGNVSATTVQAAINEIDNEMIPKSIGDAKGDLIGFSADNTPVKIDGSSASDYKVLRRMASAAAGAEYGAPFELVTSFPASPYDGQVVCLSPVTGIMWQFRYNAGSAQPYKWEFIGGSPWVNGSAGHISGASTSYASTGLTLGGNLPRTGIYVVRFGARMWASSVTHNEVNISVGGSIDANNAVHSDGTSSVSPSRTIGITAAAGTLLTMVYRNLSGATWNSMHRFIDVVPMRLS